MFVLVWAWDLLCTNKLEGFGKCSKISNISYLTKRSDQQLIRSCSGAVEKSHAMYPGVQSLFPGSSMLSDKTLSCGLVSILS